MDYPPGYFFETLPQLAATAQYIVVGTVQGYQIGEPAGASSNIFPRDVSMVVDEQLAGPPLGETIVVQQGGFYQGDQEFDYQEQPWLDEGDRAVLFIRDDSSGHYDVISESGQFVIEDDESVTAESNEPVATKVDGESWSTVRQNIIEAVQVAEERNLQPVEPDRSG